MAELNELYNTSYATIDELLGAKKAVLKNKTAQVEQGKKRLAQAAPVIDKLTDYLWIAINAKLVCSFGSPFCEVSL